MRARFATVACGVGFAAAYLGAAVALGSSPHAGASARTDVEWLSSHQSSTRLAVWLLVIALPMFCGLAAEVRAALPSGLRDVFFAGTIAFVAETAVQCWIWGALAFDPGSTPAGSSALLLHVADFWGPVLTSATLAMLVPLAIAGLRRPDWPRWAGAIIAVAALEQAVETLTVFGRHGFMAPGGVMNVVLGAALTSAAIFAAAVVAVVRIRPAGVAP